MKRTRQEKIFYYNMPGLYEKKIHDLETTEERVLHLLKHNLHLRDCDKCLIFHYWFKVDGINDFLGKENLHSLTSSESIRRCRQKIQNDYGLYLPEDEEVRLARQISEDAYRDWSQKK